MLHEELTEKILAACFEVANELGAGFLESVYEKALVIVLQETGLEVKAQVPVPVMFRGRTVGDFVADVMVAKKVMVELKAAKALLPEHQAQLINYLNATGIKVGLLVNFGNPRLEYKRLYPTNKSYAGET